MINGIGSATTSLLNTALSNARGTDAANRAGSTKTGNVSASTLMAQMAAEGAPIELDRVASIKAAIKAGTYNADPDAIAAKMIQLDVNGGAK